MGHQARKFCIIIYPSESADIGRFTAHCLNMDLIGDDDSVEGAVSELLETIEVQLEAARKHNAYAFSEAPDRYWDMLQDAQEIAAELRERIIHNANKRRSGGWSIDIESECDLRQLQPA